MAVGRLQNSEKRLMRLRETAEVYKTTIDAYVMRRKYISVKWRSPKSHRLAGSGTSHIFLFVAQKNQLPKQESCSMQVLKSVEYLSTTRSIMGLICKEAGLFDVLMHFRRHRVALVCDIKQMYVQIRLPVEDRPFFRLLWRDLQPNRQPDVFEFERVVFGDASAPFVHNL